MPNSVLVTGAAGGQQGATGRLITKLLLKKRYRFEHSSVRPTLGSMNFAKKVPKSSLEISSIRARSRRP